MKLPPRTRLVALHLSPAPTHECVQVTPSGDVVRHLVVGYAQLRDDEGDVYLDPVIVVPDGGLELAHYALDAFDVYPIGRPDWSILEAHRK